MATSMAVLLGPRSGIAVEGGTDKRRHRASLRRR